MRFCPQHWDALRSAIDSRGLGPLVAANSRDAVARLKAELDGKDEPDDFDPLMSAHWMIVARATEMGGLYLMTGDYCPVCEALKHHPADCGIAECTPALVESHWIDGPADEVLRVAREKGLVDG